MDTILVMGGSQFVSKKLAQHLISKGFTVDLVTRGKKEITYSGYRNHFKVDRKDLPKMQEILNDITYDYIFDISAYTKEDVEILHQSIQKKSLKKYIFCSTASVYLPSNELLNEDSQVGENPNWGSYGLNKLEAEQYIQNNDLPYVIFRPTYIYGFENNLYRESYFFGRILNDQDIPVPISKDIKVQFIHIDDLVQTFESTIHSDLVNKVYNLTHPSTYTFVEMINLCSNALQKEAKIVPIDSQSIPYDVRTYFPYRNVSINLDTNALQHSDLHIPTIDLKEGLVRTVHWYLKNKPQLSDKGMTKIDEVLKHRL